MDPEHRAGAAYVGGFDPAILMQRVVVRRDVTATLATAITSAAVTGVAIHTRDDFPALELGVPG